jgi:hypothetical protein
VRNTLISLFATKAKAGALVAGTALATTAVVGGGAVVLQNVGSEQAVSEAGGPATPTATIGIGKNGKGKGKENRSDTATAVLEGKDAPTTVTFTCDPSKNHGQNVSSFARSLPKGAGRGEQVSQAAQSDCGKDVKPSPTATDAATEKAEAEKAEKTAKATTVKPAKPVRTSAPVKPAKPAQAETDNETAEDARTADRPEDSRPADAGSKSQGKGGKD